MKIPGLVRFGLRRPIVMTDATETKPISRSGINFSVMNSNQVVTRLYHLVGNLQFLAR